MNENEKYFEDLDFTNDLIFKHVLSSDIELCKEFIDRIDPIVGTEDIHFVETEHEIVVGVKDEKRVRLDVMTRTGKTTADLDMYTYVPQGGKNNFPKTGRYNAAMIDAELLKYHMPSDLPDVSVILFCTFDPLDLGEPIYRIRSMVDGHQDFNYNEGRRITILTNQGIDRAPDTLKPIIHLLARNSEPIDDPLYRKVQASVREIKKDPEVRRLTMRTAEREAAIREESLKRGIKTSIEILRDMGKPEQEILTIMLSKYPDYEETVKRLMQ